MTPARAAWPSVALLATLVAWFQHGTLAGTLGWLVGMTLAAVGAGKALTRTIRAPHAFALELAIGAAALVASATLLAQLGVLSDAVVLAIVIAGGLCNVLDTNSRLVLPGHAWRWIVGGLAATVLVTAALARPEAPTIDGINYVFRVHQLHQLGRFTDTYSLGADVVGQALFSWVPGADHANLFDAWCAVGTLAIGAFLFGRADRSGDLVFGLLCIVVLLEPTTVLQPSATFFHLATICTLRAGAGEDRVCWPALLCASVLAMSRHELAFLALPYAIASVWPYCRRRGRAVCVVAIAAGWILAFASIYQLGQRLPLALAKSSILLASIPLGSFLAQLLGISDHRDFRWWTCVAAIAYLLSLASYAAPPPLHASAVTTAAWIGFALAIIVDAELRTIARLGAAPSMLAAFAAVSLALPPHDGARWGPVVQRFRTVVMSARERALVDDPASAVRELQMQTAPGRPIAFWGRSAASLDHHRNPLSDVSTSRHRFLHPLPAPRLDGAAYLLFEDIPSLRIDRRSRTLVHEDALGAVAHRLRLVSSSGTAILYEVR